MIKWSIRVIPTTSPASRIRQVKSRSERLGSGSPLGWLWTKTIPTARQRSPSMRISWGNHRSVYRSFGNKEITDQMLFGIQKHDMDFLLFQMTHIFHVIIRNLIRLCKSHRLCAYLLLPNPPGKLSDAQSWIPFTGPTPRMDCSCSREQCRRPVSPSPVHFVIGWRLPVQRDVRSLLPVRMMTANSSLSVSAFGP